MAERKDTDILYLKKYANRRYYDAANSRHLKLQEIHQLIKEGHSIQVTDGQTGRDITSEVLLGILLEFEPDKAASVPVSILTWWIRAEAEKMRELAADGAEPFAKAIADIKKRVQTEVENSAVMQEIIPGVKELANVIALPLKETIASAIPSATKAPQTESTGKSPNEDLEELIRAYDAGAIDPT